MANSNRLDEINSQIADLKAQKIRAAKVGKSVNVGDVSLVACQYSGYKFFIGRFTT